MSANLPEDLPAKIKAAAERHALAIEDARAAGVGESAIALAEAKLKLAEERETKR